MIDEQAEKQQRASKVTTSKEDEMINKRSCAAPEVSISPLEIVVSADSVDLTLPDSLRLQVHRGDDHVQPGDSGDSQAQ